MALKGDGLKMQLSAEEREHVRAVVDAILKEQENVRENLIPVLQQVQARLGYLPGPAIRQIAVAAGVPAVEVYGLATFYNQFRLHPPGEHQVKVCMGTACYMAGGRIAMECFERRLGIREGESTADRKFSLSGSPASAAAPGPGSGDRRAGGRPGHPTRVDGLLLELES